MRGERKFGLFRASYFITYMHAMKETMKAAAQMPHTKENFDDDDDGVVSFSVLAQWPFSLSLSFFLSFSTHTCA